MATQMAPTLLGSPESERLLRSQLEESWKRYQEAAGQYSRLLAERCRGPMGDAGGALATARQLESHALVEYTRVLQIFTDFVVHAYTPQRSEDV